MADSNRSLRAAIYVPFVNPTAGGGKLGFAGIARVLSRQQKLAFLVSEFRRKPLKLPGAPESVRKLLSLLRRSSEKDIHGWVETVLEERYIQPKGVKELLNASPPAISSQLGFVFYEKLSIEPAGTSVSDEIVKDVFLAPGAEVQLAKRTWSKVSTELAESTSQLREEELQSSEAETKELAASAQKQSQLSMSLGASVQASGDAGTYKISASASFNLASARSLTEARSTRELQEQTSKAASRTRQEHKMTFTQHTEMGSEYSTLEIYKNPNTSHAVVLTLRKLLKKWRVSHEQYGVRLCVDVMVKNPGRNLRSTLKIDDFDESTILDPDPTAPPEGAPQVPPPMITLEKEVTWPSAAKNTTIVAFPIPDGYELDYCEVIGDNAVPITFDRQPNPGFVEASNMGLGYYPGKYVGAYVNNYDATNSSSRTVQHGIVTAHFQLSAGAMQVWKRIARPFAVAAARSEWQARRDLDAATEAMLEKESSAPPAQMLRKEERDELLSGVARFIILGEDAPTPPSPEDASIYQCVPPSTIRKLHDSFAWEEMASFLYPYWWDPQALGGSHPLRELFRVNHKDFLRREFLRASWARVLVPVRAGHERWALEMFYGEEMKQALDASNKAAPYPIGDLVTAYLDIASHENDAVKELAAWDEYTPTDETSATMRLLTDDLGGLVDVAEPNLRSTQDQHLAQEVASTRIREALADSVEAGALQAVRVDREGDVVQVGPLVE